MSGHLEISKISYLNDISIKKTLTPKEFSESPTSDDGILLCSENNFNLPNQMQQLSIPDFPKKRSNSLNESKIDAGKTSFNSSISREEEITNQISQNAILQNQTSNKPTPVLPEMHPLCYLYNEGKNVGENLHVHFESTPLDEDIVLYSRRFGNRTWREFQLEFPQEESLEIWFPFFQWYLHHYEMKKNVEDHERMESNNQNEADEKSTKSKLQVMTDKSKTSTSLRKKNDSLPAFGANRRNARASNMRLNTNQRLNSTSSRTPMTSRIVRKKPPKNSEPLIAERRIKSSFSDRVQLEMYGCFTQELMKRRFEIYIEKLSSSKVL